MRAPGDVKAVAQCLAAGGVPVAHTALATGQAAQAPQLLVLTDEAVQSAVDAVVQAWAVQPAAAGPAVTLRVEALAG